jgi:hypothetical protein
MGDDANGAGTRHVSVAVAVAALDERHEQERREKGDPQQTKPRRITMSES